MVRCDVLVIGGGIAGLAGTAALARAGLEVICVDPAPLPDDADPPLDGRTTALFQGSLRALRRWGAFTSPTLPTEALWRMRIVDETTAGARHTATFDSRELPGGGPFGENVPNAPLRRALAHVIATTENAYHWPDTTVTDLSIADMRVTAILSSGEAVAASVAVGADGKQSMTRRAAGIAARTWTYGQTAMAFSIGHERSHAGTSTEIHRPQGPLVQVPMPGRTSSVVWVESERAAATYAALDPGAFRRVVAGHMHGVVGEIASTGQVWSYPVSSLLADELVAPRVALIGEAAHGLPPIGAQGLNLGIADGAALAEELAAARRTGADIGAYSVLTRYEARRRPDVVARLTAVDGLNRAVMAQTSPARCMRRRTIQAVARFRPLRSVVMQAGMTPLGHVPDVMRVQSRRGPSGSPVPASRCAEVREVPDGRDC